MSATPRIVTFVTRPGTTNDPNAIDIYFQGNTPLNPGGLSGGTPYDLWCLNEAITLPANATYNSYVYSSYELTTLGAIPGLPKTNLDKLDNINWLLNNYKALGASYADTQGAVWKMIGSANWFVSYLPQNKANIEALVATAMQHEGYVPGEDEAIGLVVDPMSGSPSSSWSSRPRSATASGTMRTRTASRTRVKPASPAPPSNCCATRTRTATSMTPAKCCPPRPPMRTATTCSRP